jgi:membrane fusion protein (multidrug efflux system)
MRTVKRLLYWITAFAVVFVTFWLGYTRRTEESSVEDRPVPVEVERVGTGSIEETLEVSGLCLPNARVEVASKIAGRIESLSVTMPDGSRCPVEVGLSLTRGQQLAVVDHDMHLAQVAVAEAEVKAREVQLAEAQRERSRVVGLYEKGSATEQQRDQAITAAELAAAGLTLAQANLELARINLRESTIVSPIDGIVTAKHIDEGNLVAQGQRLVSVADIETVKVLVAVPERYGPQIGQGMPVRIAVDAFRDRVFEAQVYSVYPALDEQTHTVCVEIRLDNADLRLRPGMFARVTLVFARKQDVVIVPRDVILGGKIDEPYVYVVEEGVARKRLVEIGLREGARCEIASGLRPGESLVVNGMHHLADGLRADVVRLEDIQ